MACGMKLLQNMVVLLLTLQNLLPEFSSENSPWCGCVELLSFTLVRQYLCPISRMEGREVPIIFSAVLTTLQKKVVSAAPVHQLLHLLSVGLVIVVPNEAHYCCIISVFDDMVGGGPGNTVMCHQSEEEQTQDAALRVMTKEVSFPTYPNWGLSERKSRIELYSVALKPRGASLLHYWSECYRAVSIQAG